LLGSRRGVIGTRLLNLNDVDSDHPEPMVQDISPGGTGGEPSEGRSAARTSPFHFLPRLHQDRRRAATVRAVALGRLA